MALHHIQRCLSTEPYFKQLIPSESQRNLVYEVHSIWPDDTPMDYTCSCPAFKYTGTCKHQKMAWSDRCLWTEEDEGEEKQDDRQRDEMICPRCGNETVKDLVDE